MASAVENRSTAGEKPAKSSVPEGWYGVGRGAVPFPAADGSPEIEARDPESLVLCASINHCDQVSRVTFRIELLSQLSSEALA